MPAKKTRWLGRFERLARFGALLLVASGACSRSTGDSAPGEREPARAAETPAPAPVAPAAPGASEPSPAAPSAAPPSPAVAPLSEAAVRSLLDAWLDAQNRGDFAAYEALYAERFTGIKRSGERTRSFGRRDWMEDRASMFQRPMRVTASGVELFVSSQVARVRFEQAWSSARYRDVGPKELLIVAGATSPQIAREEMLSSTIGAERPVTPEARLRLVDTGLVVLSSGAREDWSHGELRSVERAPPGVLQVLRDADGARLPAALAQRQGQAVRVFDADGRACESRVARLAVRAAITPHFSMAEAASDGTAPDPARLNREVWALSEAQGRQLVGVLEPPCEGLFALDASDVTPEIYRATPVEGDERRAAIAAFRALPVYAAIQRRYEEETRSARPWHEDPTRHLLDVWAFRPRTGPAQLVLAAEAGEYCGGFGGSASVVFGVGANGQLEPLGAFEGLRLGPQAAFDLDGDGRLEILSGPEGLTRERSLLRRRGAQVVRDLLSSVPSLDCPC